MPQPSDYASRARGAQQTALKRMHELRRLRLRNAEVLKRMRELRRLRLARDAEVAAHKRFHS